MPVMPARYSKETPDYLNSDHLDENVYDTSQDLPVIQSGTLTALVEQLTCHDKPDSRFNSTFMLTYRSFTTAPKLFTALVARWHVQPWPGYNSADSKIWNDRHILTRFQVVRVLHSWFDEYWMETDDDANQQLMQIVHAFAIHAVLSKIIRNAESLVRVVEQKMRGLDASGNWLVITSDSQARSPIVPKNMKKLKYSISMRWSLRDDSPF
ncbi:cell division cycle-related protein [Elasticomyces elasticus]|nr:cell division cycle-related protein [Elasticomyces elasticus]